MPNGCYTRRRTRESLPRRRSHYSSSCCTRRSAAVGSAMNCCRRSASQSRRSSRCSADYRTNGSSEAPRLSVSEAFSHHLANIIVDTIVQPQRGDEALERSLGGETGMGIEELHVAGVMRMHCGVRQPRAATPGQEQAQPTGGLDKRAACGEIYPLQG